MVKKQRKWAVLIGIDSYHESLGSLKYAGADCRRLKEILTGNKLGFDEEHVLLLDDLQAGDRKPTFANIHSWLSSYFAQPGEDDLVLFYFAGHGREMEGKSYLVPADATLATLHTLGIPLTNIQELMTRCKAHNKILIVDACHSGSGRDVALMSSQMEAVLGKAKGMYTIASCAADELSHEWNEKKHGVFSYFLSEALGGECVSADGRLTIDNVYEWVHDKVSSWAANHRCKQTPQRFNQGSGVIVISETEPDYKTMIATLHQQNAELQQELFKLKIKQERKSNYDGKSATMLPQNQIKYFYKGLFKRKKDKFFDQIAKQIELFGFYNGIYGYKLIPTEPEDSTNQQNWSRAQFYMINELSRRGIYSQANDEYPSIRLCGCSWLYSDIIEIRIKIFKDNILIFDGGGDV